MDLQKIKEYGNVEFFAKQLVEGFITGLHKSPFHGFSVEFAEHRAYNQGESIRHIDWKVFAKTDRLYIKNYEEETNLRCYLLVDSSSSMFFPVPGHGKLVFASMAAACIAYMLQKQKDAISLCTFSDKIELETPVKSTSGHVYTIFQHLDKLLNIQTNGRSSGIVEVLHYISEKIPNRSLVILFSDMFENVHEPEALFTALQHLKHNNHEVIVFHITDRRLERDFAYQDRPYEFTDLESGQKIQLQPSQIKEQYQKAANDYFEALKLRCIQYRITLVETDINEGFDKIMQTFLAKRR
jgi:uncharacterized protein (DUF58 family)